MDEKVDLGIIVNLLVPNSLEAIEFYKRAFSAKETSKYIGPDGTVMHAALKIIGQDVYLNDSNKEMKMLSPNELGGCPLSIWLRVEDPDKVYEKAVDAGCEVTMKMDNMFWGDRMGSIVDPYGYNWIIAKKVEDVSDEELEKRSKKFFEEMKEM
jgi:PhnB protein